MTLSFEFERNVAAIFRTLGAHVEHETDLAGNQIDVLAAEATPSGIIVRTALECKAYQKQVGVQTVNFYSQLSYLLKQRDLIDKFAIVALSGFTKSARTAAREHGIELIEYSDLQKRIAGREVSVRDEEIHLESEEAKDIASAPRKKRLFAVMPFSREFDDVFFLGIQDVGQRLGLVVERADLVEHSGEIMDLVAERIRKADVVVADITGSNANVLYEIGLAHATQVSTILVMRVGAEIPFDLRGFNIIHYENVTRLREALKRRLKAVLNLAEPGDPGNPTD